LIIDCPVEYNTTSYMSSSTNLIYKTSILQTQHNNIVNLAYLIVHTCDFFISDKVISGWKDVQRTYFICINKIKGRKGASKMLIFISQNCYIKILYLNICLTRLKSQFEIIFFIHIIICFVCIVVFNGK